MKIRTIPACTLAAIASLAAVAPTASRAETPDEWQFNATIYAWLPDMGGTTAFPPPSDGESSVEVTASDILDALNFAFMGAMSAQKGRWGLATDVNYLDLSASKKRSRDLTVGGITLPADITAKVDLGVTGWLWTTVGSYRVVDKPDYVMDLIAGARMLNLAEDLKWSLSSDVTDPPISRDGKSEVSDTFWDGVVGVKGRATFGAEKKWFMPYYVDIGTGDSDLTWLGMLGVGYSYGWGDLVAVWRYADYEFSSKDLVQDLYFNGPAFGVSFHF